MSEVDEVRDILMATWQLLEELGIEVTLVSIVTPTGTYILVDGENARKEG